MKKILAIVGPTAMGKTALALKVAGRFNGNLISADSRQVYTGMDIGTGKDIPSGAVKKESILTYREKPISYYEINGIRLWGYDLIAPHTRFSVADYIEIVAQILKLIRQENNLPILVGGTGLYLKAILDGIETAVVPPNQSLREKFQHINPAKLFEALALLDVRKANQLNASDRKNPRRLIRALEIAEWKKTNHPEVEVPKEELDVLKIGLITNRQVIVSKLKARIEKRIKQGLEGEINGLLNEGVQWKDQAFAALGYREWQDYFKKEKTLTGVKTEWLHDEEMYVKRQITWFKKDKKVIWFDIMKENWEENVEKIVAEWYASNI